jgi:hypothetical protein
MVCFGPSNQPGRGGDRGQNCAARSDQRHTYAAIRNLCSGASRNSCRRPGVCRGGTQRVSAGMADGAIVSGVESSEPLVPRWTQLARRAMDPCRGAVGRSGSNAPQACSQRLFAAHGRAGHGGHFGWRALLRLRRSQIAIVEPAVGRSGGNRSVVHAVLLGGRRAVIGAPVAAAYQPGRAGGRSRTARGEG